jgi:REP element-mobilizing transposase RayT
MSRPWRPFLSDRYIFVTVKVRKPRRHLGEGDFKRLASAMSRMRPKHRFLLTAGVFLPDHGHAIIYPPYPLTISRAMKAVKVSSMISLHQGRREAGELWQGRCFDRALRTVKEYLETVEYIPMNPVRPGRVKCAEEWKGSSVRE